MAYAIVRTIFGGSAVCDSLLNHVIPIVCGGSVFGPCFVMHYLVSFKFNNHKSCALLYLNCCPDVL